MIDRYGNESGCDGECDVVYVKSYDYDDAEKQYHIEFSNGETLYVSAEEFFEHSLYEIENPVSKGFDSLIFSIFSKRAFIDGVRFVLTSRKSEGQVRRLLSEKKYSEECIDYALAELKDEAYIDDAVFAEKFIRKAVDSRTVSVRMLLCELKMKDISEELAESSMAILEIDDCMLAQKAVNKKKSSGVSDVMKLRRFLAGKGFTHEAISKALGEEDLF